MWWTITRAASHSRCLQASLSKSFQRGRHVALALLWVASLCLAQPARAQQSPPGVNLQPSSDEHPELVQVTALTATQQDDGRIEIRVAGVNTGDAFARRTVRVLDQPPGGPASLLFLGTFELPAGGHYEIPYTWTPPSTGSHHLFVDGEAVSADLEVAQTGPVPPACAGALDTVNRFPADVRAAYGAQVDVVDQWNAVDVAAAQARLAAGQAQSATDNAWSALDTRAVLLANVPADDTSEAGADTRTQAASALQEAVTQLADADAATEQFASAQADLSTSRASLTPSVDQAQAAARTLDNLQANAPGCYDAGPTAQSVADLAADAGHRLDDAAQQQAAVDELAAGLPDTSDLASAIAAARTDLESHTDTRVAMAATGQQVAAGVASAPLAGLAVNQPAFDGEAPGAPAAPEGEVGKWVKEKVKGLVVEYLGDLGKKVYEEATRSAGATSSATVLDAERGQITVGVGDVYDLKVRLHWEHTTPGGLSLKNAPDTFEYWWALYVDGKVVSMERVTPPTSKAGALTLTKDLYFLATGLSAADCTQEETHTVAVLTWVRHWSFSDPVPQGRLGSNWFPEQIISYEGPNLEPTFKWHTVPEPADTIDPKLQTPPDEASVTVRIRNPWTVQLDAYPHTDVQHHGPAVSQDLAFHVSRGGDFRRPELSPADRVDVNVAADVAPDVYWNHSTLGAVDPRPTDQAVPESGVVPAYGSFKQPYRFTPAEQHHSPHGNRSIIFTLNGLLQGRRTVPASSGQTGTPQDWAVIPKASPGTCLPYQWAIQDLDGGAQTTVDTHVGTPTITDGAGSQPKPPSPPPAPSADDGAF